MCIRDSLWPAHARHALGASSLGKATEARRRCLTSQWNQLGLSVRGSVEQWLHAHALVWSRVFELPDGEPALVSVLELLNHSSVDFNTEWEFDTETRQIQIVSLQEIPEKVELLHSYGDKSNEELMFHYGFFEALNRHSCCSLVLPQDQDQILAGIKNQLLTCQRVLIGRGAVSAESAASLRVAAIGAKDEIPLLVNWLEEHEGQGPIGPQQEEAAIALLVRLIQSDLTALGQQESNFYTDKLDGTTETRPCDGTTETRSCDRTTETQSCFFTMAELYLEEQRTILRASLDWISQHGLQESIKITEGDLGVCP
eukprot:TRINITY_DN29336_c0_g1_i2.p1 TRINITY_DN29336_c0_g1~~TRINITY_DN29336_c0_g1_i2.p1  ORF type:complete len:313 (-),score=42.14 TRINITY_DN29336_c0_g1_i2:61-999(-)